MCPTQPSQQLDAQLLNKKLVSSENAIRSKVDTNFAGVLALRATLLSQSSQDTAAVTPSEKLAPAIALSTEERTTLLEKLRAIAQLPTTALTHDETLYIEQQLGELLGFEVATELDGHRIPHVTGVARSTSHIKTSPTDTLSQHGQILEAGITDRRSHFGWQYNRSTQQVNSEHYGITVPLLLSTAQADSAAQLAELLDWYKNQKILLINAHEYIAAVCSVVDTFIDSSGKYQYGTTPEVSRECLLWSPNNRGKVIALFVHDRVSAIDPGIYSLV